MQILQGVYCPVLTPFVDDEVGVGRLRENLEKLNSFDLSGYVVLGSTGEPVHLTRTEKIEVIKTARASTPDSKQLIVGSGYESTKETLEFTRVAADLGADFVLVVTPYYYASHLHAECYKKHFGTVADNSPVPVILYSVPVFTKLDLSVKIIAELSEHQNIVGIKESTARIEKLLQVLTLTSEKISGLVGNLSLLAQGFLGGARGAILSICNISPALCVEIYKHSLNNDFTKVREKTATLLPLLNDFVSVYGIAAIKAAADMVGFYGGLPRTPFLPLGDVSLRQLQNCLATADLIKN